MNGFVSIIRKGLEVFGRFYSSYYGWVTDNDDPNNLNQLMVYVPEVKGIGSDPIMTLPLGLYSGKGYGLQIIPEIGDMVTITFRFGDPNFPLWSFGNYGKNEKPDEFKDIKVKGLITPSGIKILIDDNDPSITLLTKEGFTVVISDKDKDISINSPSGVQWVLDNTSIKLGKTKLEYSVLGETLKDLLSELLTYLGTSTNVIVNPYPGGGNIPGTPSITTIEKLTEIKNKFSSFLANFNS